MGADTRSDLDPSGYPSSVSLLNFHWYGNTGGVPIPRMVNTVIDGVPIVLDASYVTADTSVIQSLPLTPGVALPVAIFDAFPVSGTAPLSVAFVDQSIGTIDFWSFGDGTTSTEQNPSHTYNNSGSYTVSLSVTGSQGTDTKTRSNDIAVNGPPHGGGDSTKQNFPLDQCYIFFRGEGRVRIGLFRRLRCPPAPLSQVLAGRLW